MMNKIEELEKAVLDLSETEFKEFRNRFLMIDNQKWDDQILVDSESGKLDFLIDEAQAAKRNQTLEDL